MDFFDDPMRLYGLMMFLVRAKEESRDANVIFDAHAADFGILLSERFQEMLDDCHPRLHYFKARDGYFLDTQNPVFQALLARLCDLLGSEGIRRSIQGCELDRIVRNYFSPYRLSKGAAEIALAAAASARESDV